MPAISLFILFLPVLDTAQQLPANRSTGDPSQNTLQIMCQDNEKPRSVLSPVSLSEDHKWRAYVEVDLRSGCLHTTRLWVARPPGAYRMVYMMPPKRNDSANGMEILGWATNSSMLLVRTAEWQYGSDAALGEQVLAIDAGTGMVYQPELEAMLDEHKDKQCWFRVLDAGFAAEQNVKILVRAQFQTEFDVDETEEDVPPAKRCGNFKETWSFNFANGEIKKEADAMPLRLFKKFLPQPTTIDRNGLTGKPAGVPPSP
jgi:hypothetical protein